MVTREVGSFSVRSGRRTCVELWDKEELLIVIRFMCITEFML